MMAILANTIRPFHERYGMKTDYKEMIEKCGANTGNVVFHDAIWQQIKFDKEIISYDDLETAKESAVYVLPAANWINRNGRVLQMLFGNLSHSHIRVLVLGLGIQMKLGESKKDFVDSLSKETVAALKTMSEHSISIGVRGAVTGAVLDCLGIHNWQVIGCPSYYEPYRKNITIRQSKSVDKILYNIKPTETKTDKIFDLAVKTGSRIVIQSRSDMESCEQVEYNNTGGGYYNIFSNRKAWEEYLFNEKISFSTGLRFHGNMMAFSCGIPALWIVSDERTHEMVESMKLPYIHERELENMTSPDALIELADYNEVFRNHYKQMAEAYVEFLEKNGVEHCFGRNKDGRDRDSNTISQAFVI